MIDLTTQLHTLIQKEPVVSTFDSRTIISHPEDVVTSYDHHATTYIELDLLRDLGQRFIDRIIHSQTPKVCLVARYGYGKTTAAIGLWQACRKADIVAVPPAGYTSMAEIAATVYSWVRTALYGNVEALRKLGELHATYLRSSTEELAKLVSKRSGRSYEQVIAILTDPALERSLRLDPPTANIVLFLEALTHIVATNGYSGVAVFVDEFQQLLGKAGADVLTALRSLVWGLRTRKIPLGLVITMDPNSERILAERAGDILHRIKDDDLYLDFQQIHSADFPRLLWERYAKQLGLEGLTFQVVDKPTLEALGQICERADLSNGPRTVANVFRRVASYYAATQRTYTPLQLIDDFLTGAIIFDGDANTIASLVTEFAGYAYFKRTDAHLAVLKLLAAFPAGCPSEVAEYYGLSETFKDIITELRGDIVTLLPGGFALIDLQRVGKPLNKLSLILKKYWMQITNNAEESAETTRRFAEYILPLLFPAGTAQAESWNTEVALSLSAYNTYTQTFVGYLHARHPLRRIRTIVSTEEVPPAPDKEDVDMNVMFVIHHNVHGEQRAFRRQDKHLVFHVDLGRVPQNGLPSDLRLIEHNLSPQPGTPAVLLNVIEFIEREISLSPLKQSELVQVTYALENIRRWLLSFIFDERLLKALDAEAATPGYRGIRDLLFRECERRFPRYKTMITSSIWRDNLARYREVLAEGTLAQRRGIEPVKGPKAKVAALFGQRNHAGFESKMRIQYPLLLDIVWAGDQGIVTCTPHPIETAILASLEDEGRAYGEVVELCRAEGYTREEIEEIFALLVARGNIKEKAERVYKTDSISIAELQRICSELVTELQAFEIVLPTGSVDENLSTARSLAAIQTDTDEERQLAHARLITLAEATAKLRVQARHAFLEMVEAQRNKVAALLQGLDNPIPGFAAPVSFKNHLDGVRKELEEEAVSMRRSGVRLRESLQATRNQLLIREAAQIGTYLLEDADRLRQRDEMLAGLQMRFEVHQQSVALLKQWISWGESFVRLRHNISNLAVQLKEAEPINAQLAEELDRIECKVRESLSYEGVTTLEQLPTMQCLLENVAKEYDRNLVERELVFETEKARLEATIAIITDDKRSLKGKYQISKHEESYHDIYMEVLQMVQDVVDSLVMRVNLFDARMQDMQKVSSGENVIVVDRRAIKTLARKLVEGQKRLAVEGAVQHALLEEVAGQYRMLRKQLDEAERKIPSQAPLLPSETLLAKLSTKPQDLRILVDVRAALLSLPIESDLTALLQLCLDGNVVVGVHRKFNLVETDDE